jgi:hypothetical protein
MVSGSRGRRPEGPGRTRRRWRLHRARRTCAAQHASPTELSFFFLRPDVQPGGYRWPLLLSVPPL